MIRSWLLFGKRWMDDGTIWLVFIATIGVVAVVVLSLRMSDTAFNRCMASGGAWRRTGSHTTYQMIGRVVSPITSYTYRCEP